MKDSLIEFVKKEVLLYILEDAWQNANLSPWHCSGHVLRDYPRESHDHWIGPESVDTNSSCTRCLDGLDNLRAEISIDIPDDMDQPTTTRLYTR